MDTALEFNHSLKEKRSKKMVKQVVIYINFTGPLRPRHTVKVENVSVEISTEIYQSMCKQRKADHSS